MSTHARLPAAPLKRELWRAKRRDHITWTELAVHLRVSARTLARVLDAQDLAEPVADRMACRLGLHPIIVWPTDWLADAQERSGIAS